jgi:hypothetical protein
MSSAPVVLEREHWGAKASSPVVTAATVRKMGTLIRNARSDRAIAAAVADALKPCTQGIPQLACIWWWIKHRVKFLHHDAQICKLLNQCNGGEFQLLISPSVLLRMKTPEGDCATFTMLADAMVLCCGYPVRILTLAADRTRPGEYSHVYGAARDNGRWIPLDVSHGKYPGWEVPAYDVQRQTIWDLDANIISDVTA